ncbi:diguanylate cyclase [Sediminispirochaeta smaragdinae DSM 11293]|uniref:diguanylate cyclase n=2 Tax=Sediminispirochaeta TaxID=1911556 RepID=E1R9X9_SEDSS|nr:diguanylate cyclase [Sediminispirochaeta smaragdinae DSM 11293]
MRQNFVAPKLSKGIIALLYSRVLPNVSGIYRDEFVWQRFHQNNFKIFLLSIFLLIEQGVYALFIVSPHSVLHQIYVYSAVSMIFFSLISGYLFFRPPKHINIFHSMYEIIPALFWMGIALLRFLLIEFTRFRIPTIYFGVIYGIAVILFFPYWKSFLLYALLCLSAVTLIPIVHPQAMSAVFAADIISNGMLAWIVSMINYRNFVTNFRNKKIIEEKNRDLCEKHDQIKRINIELKRISVKDELTGLYNRRKIDDLLKHEWERTIRYKTKFTVIMMDIDHFKKINDTYGHDAGDLVLKKLSRILLDNIRKADSCGRWGGEEFLIICQEADCHQSLILAERFRDTISKHRIPDLPSVTASFGIASSEESSSIQTLLKAADSRLYEAKLQGRNRVVGVPC